MGSDVFFDYFLKSLRFHLGDRCKDIGFIEFVKDENNSFIMYKGLYFRIISGVVKYFE